MDGKTKQTYINTLRSVKMLTKEYLKDHYIDAYFIDEERKNIEILTTSEDSKKVIPTIIPFDENNDMFQSLKTVVTVDDLHERTYVKKKEEKKLFDEMVLRIAKKDGMILDEQKLDTKFFPTLVKAIFEEVENEDHLFALKLALFEVEQIRNSDNAELKADIRKGKTKVEVLLNALKLISE
tara:strand:+ start:2093 stop:2635 length:543 start_codon:yes stop_codon:yes gene_type:complete